MRKITAAAARTLILLLWVSAARPVKAQQELPYHLYLPLVAHAGYIYLPLISNVTPQSSVPPGGTITAVVFDPVTPQTIYAASFDGGVYKSMNGGISWFQVNNGLPTVEINTLAIDPTDPSVLYAGPYRYGIYKTSDGGLTWVKASSGLPDQTIAYSIAVTPAAPQTVYVGFRIYISGWGPPWYGGIYKSTDGGLTWSAAFINIGGSGEQDWVYSLELDPSSPSTIYAAAHETGMYRSRDSGKTWQPIDTGLTDLTTRTVIADPGNPAVLYTATWHRNGVFKSLDHGDTWTNYPDGSYGGKFMQLAVDPKNTATLYAATENLGILKSTSAGTSWFNVLGSPTFFYCIAVDPANSSILLAGASAAGLWESADHGATWSQVHWGFTSTGKITDLSTLPDFSAEDPLPPPR